MKVKIGKLEPEYDEDLQNLVMYNPDEKKNPVAKEYVNKFAWFPVTAECSTGSGDVYIIWLKKYKDVNVFMFGSRMRMTKIFETNKKHDR